MQDTGRMNTGQYEDTVCYSPQEGKVMVLGEGNEGKTTTIYRIENQGKPLSGPAEVTAGVEIDDIKIHDVKCRFSEKEQDFIIHYWDFGGQVTGRSMHQMFMTDYTVYVVVVSNRSANMRKHVLDWLNTVKTLAPHSPVLLAINRWEGVEEISLDQKKLMADENFPNLRGIITYSAKDMQETGIQILSKKITELVLEQREQCYPKISEKWELIKAELKQCLEAGEKYLNPEDFFQICEKYEVGVEESEELLIYLNRLGVCFSYHLYLLDSEIEAQKQKKSCLKEVDYRILDPKWLTNAIYILLEHGNDDAEEKEKDGILSKKDIRKLLKDSTLGVIPGLIYTKEKEFHQILNIMKRFQLCYQISETKYFFPELCQKGRPVNWLPDAYLRHSAFEMVYDYLPESLFHCLMVCCYPYMDGDLLWNRGFCVKLMGQNCEAFFSLGNETDRIRIDFYSGGEYSHGAQLCFLRKQIEILNQRFRLIMSEENILLEDQGRIGRVNIQTILEAKQEGDEEYRVTYFDEKNHCIQHSKRILINDILEQVCDIQMIRNLIAQAKQENHLLGTEELFQAMFCTEEKLLESTILALSNLQNNHYYNGDCLENVLNDFLRDELGMLYYLKDQPRQGSSSSGTDAGEADLVIYKNKNQKYALLEALRMESLNLNPKKRKKIQDLAEEEQKEKKGQVKNSKENLDEHIQKALYKYDKHGLPITYVIIYYRGTDLEAFWEVLKTYVKTYSFPFDREGVLEELSTGYAEMKVIRQRLKRSGQVNSFHILAVKLTSNKGKNIEN